MDITVFLANLPAYNGLIEVGIAVGVDPALEDNLKLAVILVTERINNNDRDVYLKSIFKYEKQWF